MSQTFIILGASRGAREVYWFVQDASPGSEAIFVDDVTDTRDVVINGRAMPVSKDWNLPKREYAGFVVGIGEPTPKRIMVEKALAKGLAPAPPLVGHSAIVRPDCRIGRGGLIGSHSTLTCEVTIGDYVLVFCSTFGSEVVIGDYSTVYAGSHIASGAHVGEGASIGASTVVRENVKLAPGVVTGASSCVTRDVTETGVTVVGVPARPMKR